MGRKTAAKPSQSFLLQVILLMTNDFPWYPRGYHESPDSVLSDGTNSKPLSVSSGSSS
jgi:hypothetical protein